MDIKSLLVMSSLFSDIWETKSIINKTELKPFTGYCQSAYKFTPKMENYNLEKLLVIFRHGARSPTRNISKAWKSQKCISCSLKESMISNCQRKECSEGELTRRGFEQMVGLGKYIKKVYKPLLFDSKVKMSNLKMRATRIPRTHASLAGVIKGLTGDTTIENVKIPEEEDSLITTLGCVLAKSGSEVVNFFDKPGVAQDNRNFSIHQKPQERADHYYTSMCSGVNIDCRELNCEMESIVEHMKAANDSWTYMTNFASRDKKTRRSVFGTFARDLLFDIGEEKQILLYSAHDSSVSSILAGLDTGVAEWPSYASALFIEIWCNTGKQYARLIFNDKVIKPKNFSTEYIPIRSFIDLLGDMAPSGSCSDRNPDPRQGNAEDPENAKSIEQDRSDSQGDSASKHVEE